MTIGVFPEWFNWCMVSAPGAWVLLNPNSDFPGLDAAALRQIGLAPFWANPAPAPQTLRSKTARAQAFPAENKVGCCCGGMMVAVCCLRPEL